MEKFFVLLSLLTSTAFASSVCPELKGAYDCQKTKTTLLISQFEKNGTSTFVLNDTSKELKKLIADTMEHEIRIEDTVARYIAYCANEMLVYKFSADETVGWDKASGAVYSTGENGSLIIESFSMRKRSTQQCERIPLN